MIKSLLVGYMGKIFFLLSLLGSLSVFSQSLDCEDFKDGIYYAEISEPINVKWKITRNGNQQIEEVIELPEEAKKIGYPTEPQYQIIEWIDDCTYHSKYDGTKFKLSQSQKMMNDNGGVLTKIVKVEGNCYYYVGDLINEWKSTENGG